jgi:CHASE3 domain sensor protein
VAEVRALALEAETGARGYLLTGQDHYLEPYELARRVLPSSVARLGILIRDNPSQVERVERVRDLADRRLQVSAALIASDRTDRLPRSAISLLEQGKRTSDDLLRQLDAMQEDEQRLLQRDSLHHILSGARHLLSLINEVLDIAAIEAGRLTLSLEPVAVADVAAETVSLIGPLANQHHIVLVGPNVSCANRAPSRAPAWACRCPSAWPRPWGAPWSWSAPPGRAAPSGSSCHWSRVPSSTTSASGRSNPSPVEEQLEQVGPGPTVLYIEDNLSNLQLVERVLARRPGVKLISAMRPQLGLDLAGEHHPDLILLDLHLPDMPGEEVLRRLQTSPKTAPVRSPSSAPTPDPV